MSQCSTDALSGVGEEIKSQKDDFPNNGCTNPNYCN